MKRSAHSSRVRRAQSKVWLTEVEHTTEREDSTSRVLTAKGKMTPSLPEGSLISRLRLCDVLLCLLRLSECYQSRLVFCVYQSVISLDFSMSSDRGGLPPISLPTQTPGEARDFNPNDGSYSEPYKYHEDHSYAKSKFYFSNT